MSGGKIGCVVVAAGKGTRAGFDFNKAFYPLSGRSVLSRCLDALCESGMIDEIVLVLAESDKEEYEKLTRAEGSCPLVTRTVAGGETRQASVRNGLNALCPDTDIALIHDAARPFVSREIISAVIADAREYGSGVISTPVFDTIKVVSKEGFAVSTPDRSALRAVQTPQAFRYREIMEAHRLALSAPESATDDAALYEKAFGRVKLTQAENAQENVKLTTRYDFERAESAFCVPRIGSGYDVHRLTEDRKLILCGVEIPYEKGLLGHSDADVALHALMDAMLGAAALGDIGHLFPDTDDRYLGISSLKLLRDADTAIRKAGFRVGNADVTIVCQRPKLAPYISQMRQNIAEALCVPVEHISVKATTTEKLGFEGEGKGISAQSVVTLLPDKSHKRP